MKIKSANGLTGHIFPSYTCGPAIFRVYSDDHETFTDYRIRHTDLMVTICDEDAFFYEYEDNEDSLDHSPETLGIENENCDQ